MKNMTTYEDRYEKWMADLMREAEEAIEFPESRERLEKGFINLDEFLIQHLRSGCEGKDIFINLDEFLIQHLRSGCEGKDMIVDETSRRMFAVLNVIAEKINKIKGDSFAE